MCQVLASKTSETSEITKIYRDLSRFFTFLLVVLNVDKIVKICLNIRSWANRPGGKDGNIRRMCLLQ